MANKSQKIAVLALIFLFTAIIVLNSADSRAASELETALTETYKLGEAFPALHVFVGDNAPTTDVILMSNIVGRIQLIAGTRTLPMGVSTLCSEYSSAMWRPDSLFIDVISSQKTIAENGKVGLYVDDQASLTTIQLRNAVSNFLTSQKITVVSKSKTEAIICSKYPTAETAKPAVQETNQSANAGTETSLQTEEIKPVAIEAPKQDAVKIEISDENLEVEEEEESGFFAGIANIFSSIWDALMSLF